MIVKENTGAAPNGGACLVFGEVRLPATPFSGVRVRAYDRDLRRSETLGEVPVNSDGTYRIEYALDAGRRAERGRVDIVVVALVAERGGKGGWVEIAHSHLVHNAPASLRVDLEAALPLIATEYERLAEAMPVLLQDQGVELDDLAEDDTHQDASFLARETGEPMAAIEAFVVAQRIARVDGIDPRVHHALIREGLLVGFDPKRLASFRLAVTLQTPVEPLAHDVAALDARQVTAAVRRAVKRRIVPQSTLDRLEDAVHTLDKRRDEARAWHARTGPQRIADVIDGALQPEQIERLAGAIREQRPDTPAALARVIREQLDRAAGAGAKDRIEVAALVGFQPDAMARVRERLKLGEGDASRRLARASAEDVARAGLDSDDPAAAASVARAKADLDARFPTAALAGKLERDADAPVAHREAVVRFLDANPEFDLVRDHFARLEDDKASTEPEVERELRALQRLVRLTPHYEQIRDLKQMGFTSAQKVVAQGEARFISAAAATGSMSEDEARGVYARARVIRDGTVLLSNELRALREIRDTPMQAISGTEAHALLERVEADFPDIAALFGHADACGCKHCRSVWGPAAYLVDALAFLQARQVRTQPTTGNPAGGVGDAWAVLSERRPDLLDIDLDCANAETELPHIDLVCELLEEAVAPSAGVFVAAVPTAGTPSGAFRTALRNAGIVIGDTATIHGPRGELGSTFHVLRDPAGVWKLWPEAGGVRAHRLRQTLDDRATLMAGPAYVNADAYASLKGSDHAFLLPFDLDLVTARAWLNALGAPRASLIALFDTGGGLADRLAAERLGLGWRERDLITGDISAAPADIWSTSGAPLPGLATVSTFLAKTGLSFEELEELVASDFVGAGELTIERPVPDPANPSSYSPCDTSQMTIEGLGDAALDRSHRFLRLRRRLGWSITMLDVAVMAPRLGKGKLDDAALIAIAELETLRLRSGQPLDELLTLYGALITKGVDSLFARRYRRAPRARELGLAALRANAALPPADPARQTLASARAQIAAAIGQSGAATDTLIAAATTRAGDPALSIRGLAEVLAPLTLARLAGSDASEMLALAARSGRDPFSGPAATLRFLDLIEQCRASTLQSTDLDHLLAFAAPDSAARGLSNTAAAALLGRIAEAAAKAERDALASMGGAFDGLAEAEALAQATADALALAPQMSAAVAKGIGEVHAGAATANGKAPADFINQDLAPVLAGDATDALVVAALLQPRAAALAGAATPEARAAARRKWLDAILSVRTIAIGRIAAARDALESTLKLDAEIAEAILDEARLRQPAGAGAPLLRILLTDSALINWGSEAPTAADTSAAGLAHHRGALQLAAALGRFADALQLAPAELEWLLKRGGDLGWIALDAIPAQPGQTAVAFEGFTRLLDGIALARAQGGTAVSRTGTGLAQVLELSFPDGAPSAPLLAAVAVWTGNDPALLSAIDTTLSLSPGGAKDYRDPALLRRLIDAAALLRRTRLDLASATALASAAGPDAGAASAARDALRRATDPESWSEVARAAMAPIRTAKRDALVALLLARNGDLRDANDLFAYFLIDVEMQPCATTSRIVAAHGSLQLFVTRCLMGLEPEAVADTTLDPDWSQWDWMKNYRVWEANRKVFVYPENWIDPELRDDPSEQFKTMRDALQQGDLSTRATEDAAEQYLAALDEIGNLEVVACHEMVARREMHVLARTRGGDPAVYYHRIFEKERNWTPWTKVDLDIASDQIAMFTRNGRLFVAWLLFSEEADERQNGSVQQWPPVAGSSPERARRRWKVQLAVSERDRGHWRTPRLSRGSLTSDWYDLLPRRDGFRLSALGFGGMGDLFSAGWRAAIERTMAADTEQLVVTYLDTGRWPGVPYDNNASDRLMGSFALSGCKGVPEPTQSVEMPPSFLPQFVDTVFLNQRFREYGPDTPISTVNPGNDLAIISPTSFGYSATILKNTPEVFWRPGTRFRITYPLQATLFDTLIYLVLGIAFAPMKELQSRLPMPLGTTLPFFFDDGQRNYAVVPQFFSLDEGDERRKTFTDVSTLWEKIVDRTFFYLDKTVAAIGDPAAMQAVRTEYHADPKVAEIKVDWASFEGLVPGYRFDMFHHPLVCAFRKSLSADGMDGLISRATQALDTGFRFEEPANYDPTLLVHPDYPREIVDFSPSGAYASYNWELFFHLPYLIGMRLMRRGRFPEAQAWLHRIFSPIGAQSGPAPQRWWVTRPFAELDSSAVALQRIETILYGLAADPDSAANKAVRDAIDDWRSKPFRPHVIARTRPVAYMRSVVMHYVELLLGWGDSLFRQYTMESVNEARQYYVLADRLLGERPQIVPAPGDVPAQSFNELSPGLDAFGNALAALENYMPPPGPDVVDAGPDPLPATGVSMRLPYFCVPPNERAFDYWDRVADRLFKIRHCRNIDGIEVPLALFAPPIDPGALVRAVAAGLDIGDVVAGFGAPLPVYRFNVLAQKASELASEARALSAAMLSALEKRDGEGLARLRAEHELSQLDAVLGVRRMQKAEAQQQIQILDRQRETIDARIQYYRSREYMNTGEAVALGLNIAALIPNAVATGMHLASAIISLAPTLQVGIAGAGGSPTVTAHWGSQNVTSALSSGAAALSGLGGLLSAGAGLAGTIAGYDRRQEEWDFQRELAEHEKRAIEQQKAAAQIRLTMADREISNQELQISNSKAAFAYLEDKFTNAELYDWMVGRLMELSNLGLGLALDMARKAERCYRHELGSDASFIGGTYWSDTRRGLNSADSLIQDIKRMETSYLEANRRECELSIDISLADLDPEAVIELRRTGSCFITIPESRFDAEHSGYYMRRLKSVDLSMPLVAGPHGVVGARLTLVSNRYRASMRLLPNPDGYAEVASDDRFVYGAVGVRSITTSRAHSDSGMFEQNLRDDRYLPFEGAGAISVWRIELVGPMPSYDRNSITDVIMSMRYTARDGGSGFAQTVNAGLANRIETMALANGARNGLWVAIDLRQSEPLFWDQLVTSGSATYTLDPGSFPLFTDGRTIAPTSARWVAQAKNAVGGLDLSVGGTSVPLTAPPSLASSLPGEAAQPIFAASIAPPAFATPFTVATTSGDDLGALILLIKFEFS